MALGSDSVRMLVPQVIRDVEIVQDVITIVGGYYILKNAVKFACGLYVGFRNFVWARFYPVNFPTKYGTWAVVTGATDGIGKGYAKELSRRGMKVLLVSRDELKLTRVAKEIEAETGGEVKFVVADFTTGRELFPRIERAMENMDVGILVNNVGTTGPGLTYFTDMSEKEVRNMMDVNASSMVTLTHMVLPGMASRRRGAIINISSAASCFPVPLFTLYAGTKALCTHFSRSLYYECGSNGVTIQCVIPNAVDTNMTAWTKHAFVGIAKVFYPNPDAYARSAVATLPYATCTTGYWSHGLQHLIPTWLLGPDLTARLMFMGYKKNAQKSH